MSEIILTGCKTQTEQKTRSNFVKQSTQTDVYVPLKRFGWNRVEVIARLLKHGYAEHPCVMSRLL